MLQGSLDARSLRDGLRPPFARWCGSLTGVRHAQPRRTVAVHAGSRIGELKDGVWFLLVPAPFTSGGRTGKGLLSAVSPAATIVLSPP